MFGEIVKNLFKKQDVKESQEVVTRTYNIKFSQFENLESFRKVPVFEIHITPQSKLTIGREMFEDLYTSISDEVKKAIGKFIEVNINQITLMVFFTLPELKMERLIQI